MIEPGMNIGTSSFTPAGYPKAVPLALAERMKQENFAVNLWTGASTGQERSYGTRYPYFCNRTRIS